MKNIIVEPAVRFKKNPPRRRIATLERVVRFAAIIGVFWNGLAVVRSQESPEPVETSRGPVVAQVSTVPENPTSLSPIVLSVVLEKPKEIHLATNDVEGVYGDFDVDVCDENKETPRELDASRDVVVRRWTLYPKRRGTLVLPPIPLTLSDNLNASDVAIILPERQIEIPTSDAPTVPIESIVPSWSPIQRFPTLIVLTSAFAFALALGIIAAIRKRFRRVADVAKPNVPQESPSKTALRKLDELKESRLYLENDVKFYPAVSAILRRYLAEEFGLYAEEKTTQEVAAFLSNAQANDATQAFIEKDVETNPKNAFDEARIPIYRAVLTTSEIRRDVERSLSAVDLVKFARRSPTFDDARQIFDATRRAVAAASERLAAALRELEEQRRLEARRATQTNNQPAFNSSDADADR